MSKVNHVVTIGRYHCTRFNRNGEKYVRCIRCPRRIRPGERMFRHSHNGKAADYYCIRCAELVRLL
jgi:hypothetical protein